MTYIEQFEAELLQKLNGTEDEATIVRWVSERVLESYRKGIAAGQKGTKVIRKGESRRRSEEKSGLVHSMIWLHIHPIQVRKRDSKCPIVS